MIAQSNTSVPVSLADVLAHADGMLKQVDPAKLELVKKELSLTNQGPQKLANIIDGGTFLLSTLDSVLPETTSVLKTSRIVLTTAADKNPGIMVATGNLSRTFVGVNKMVDAIAGSSTRRRKPFRPPTICSPTTPTPWWGGC